MRDILHISDVHFGPPHLPELSEAVLRMVEERRPHLVVLSGDLTQRAKVHQFRQARHFVDQLAAPAVVVPGNHDVPLYRFWERLFRPFGAYRRAFSRELEPCWRDDELLVVGINSAFNWTLTDGRITLGRLRAVATELEAAPAGLFKIVVVHHHIIPPPRFGTQRVLYNAYEAIEQLSSVGVDLILSGHLHQAFIGNSEEFYPKGRLPMVILHSGTTTSRRGRGAERDKNTCNWIRVDEQTVTVSMLRWEARARRFTEHSRHLYPRLSRSPYDLEGRAP